MIKIYISRVSRKIKNLREKKNLTQEELADQLGISRQSIISVEKGKCLPSLPLALHLANIFDMPIENIFLNEKKGGANMHPRHLMPLSPFGDLDRFFNNEEPPNSPKRRSFVFPAVNVKQSDKDIILTADIPGMNADDLDIEVGDDFIDIRGERKEEIEEKDEGYFHRESIYGSFARRIPIPCELQPEKAQADIQNGQLKLVIPKKEATKPKVTKVKVKKS